MSGFEWSDPASAAAIALAEGQTRVEAAKVADVTERTIYRWLQDPDFGAEVDRLTLMVGIASRAERLRIAKRVVAAQLAQLDPLLMSKENLLAWLKFAQSETDGIQLNLTALLEDAPSVAGGRPGGVDPADGAAQQP